MRDLSDLDHGMIVGIRNIGASISDIVDLQKFSRTTSSRVYRERSEKQTLVSNSSVSKTTLLTKEVKEEWPDLFKLTGKRQVK